MANGPLSLDVIASGGKAALALALAAIEARPEDPQIIALLDAAYAAPRAQVIGLTGPPGVGKSTLVNALIAHWRGRGLTVGVIAVDPSSQVSGGALLGDRTRLATDPDDDGVFVRSMAARGRLGGIADLTVAAAWLMRSLFDRVVVETVGVGQSETDIARLADTTVFCVQPASGDSLQFMKAGIMEVPHIVAVNKADLDAASRAAADVRSALSLSQPSDGPVPVVLVSAATGRGVVELADAIDAHFARLCEDGRIDLHRRRQAAHWVAQTLLHRFGTHGRAKLGDKALQQAGEAPFSRLAELSKKLGG